MECHNLCQILFYFNAFITFLYISGDMMVAINDITVTCENLQVVCHKLSSKVVSINYS